MLDMGYILEDHLIIYDNDYCMIMRFDLVILEGLSQQFFRNVKTETSLPRH